MAHVTSMATNDNTWGSYWLNRPMPILEASKTNLQQMLRRAERVRAADVAHVVLADPLLTLQALRFIGRRERTSMAAEVVSIESIVMLMGVAPFLERFGFLPTVESVLLPAAPSEYAVFMQLVMQARFSARLAQIYADLRYDARMDEIVVAALLSRSNALLTLVGGRLDSTMPRPDDEPCRFLSQQKIAQAVVSLLDGKENTVPRAVLQQSVLRLSDALQTGWWQQPVVQELDLIAKVLEVPPDLIWQTLCRVALAFAHEQSTLPDVIQPARWLAMLPGEWPAPILPDEKQAVSRGATADPLSTHLQALHQAGKQRTTAKDIMALAVRALAEGAGMQRIVFALISPGLPELHSRFVMGWPQDHAIRKLQIRTDAAGLFAKLMEKPQGLWIRESNARQYQAHIPAIVREGFSGGSFCLMSIFAGNKPIGLIMADRSVRDLLTENHYKHFKQICLLTTQALTYNARQ